MPVFVAAIGGMLLNIVGTLVGRVLIAAGISVITYTGLSMTLDGLKANAIAAFHLAPLATPLSSILLGFPLAFAQELDARGVCKHMQAVAAWAVVHSHIHALLPAAHRAVVGRSPRQTRHFEERLHQPQRLAQRQVKQAFDGQAKLDSCIREGLAASALARGRGKPLQSRVKPDGQIASHLQCCVVGFPICGAVLAPAPARFTHHPSLPQPRQGYVQQRRADVQTNVGRFLKGLTNVTTPHRGSRFVALT